MFIDIVIPKDNEKDFIKTAEAIGTKGLCFLYTEEEYNAGFQRIKEVKEYAEKKGVNTYCGLLLDRSNIKKVRVLRKRLKPDLTASSAGERNELDNNINLLFELEEQRKDFMKFRNSGLDFVKARIMNEKNILLGISFNLLFHSKQKNRIIGRFMQNIKICRKKKVELLIASFARKKEELRPEKELKSLLFMLKASTEQIKKAGDSLHNKIILNSNIYSGKIIEPGIERLSDEEIKQMKTKSRKETNKRKIKGSKVIRKIKYKKKIKKGGTPKKKEKAKKKKNKTKRKRIKSKISRKRRDNTKMTKTRKIKKSKRT